MMAGFTLPNTKVKRYQVVDRSSGEVIAERSSHRAAENVYVVAKYDQGIDARIVEVRRNRGVA